MAKQKHPGGRPPLFEDRVMRTLSLERRHLEELEELASEAGVTVSVVLREVLEGRLRRPRRRG